MQRSRACEEGEQGFCDLAGAIPMLTAEAVESRWASIPCMDPCWYVYIWCYVLVRPLLPACSSLIGMRPPHALTVPIHAVFIHRGDNLNDTLPTTPMMQQMPSLHSCSLSLSTASSPLQPLAFRVLISFCLLDVLIRPPCIQHVSLLLDCARLLIRFSSALPERACLELSLYSNGPVSAKSLTHIDHALFALGVPFLQLLALRGKRVFQRRSKAVAWGITLDHYAVAVLQAESQGGSCVMH